MSGMKVLPRYRMGETGAGCAQHDDPSCLCDVVIGDEPAPVLSTRHKYHDIALNELGDDVVSERNLVEFFSIVLGLHQLERALMGIDYPVLRTSWQALPANVATALHHHARADSPWRIASMELEGLDIDPNQVKKLRHDYAQVSGGIRAKGRKRPPVIRDKKSDEQSKSDRNARRARQLSDPAARAAYNERKRVARASLKTGKTWLESKRTGATLVPGTREMGEHDGSG